jgi:hypothetical protein
MWIDFERCVELANGGTGATKLVLEHPQQIQAIKVSRHRLKNMSIQRLGFHEAARLMESKCLIE